MPFRLYIICLLFSGAFTSAAAAHPPQATSGVQYAVIIAGIGGEQQYIDQNLQWSTGIYKALKEENGFAEERLFLMVEKPEADPDVPARKSTLKEIQDVFEHLGQNMQPSDDLFIIMIGHGNATGGDAKLSIPGPDLSASALNKLLDKVQIRYLAVVNGASSSAPFIDALSGSGRAIITATKSGGERLATVFPAHFMDALTTANSDLDKDGRISLLETFNYTRLKTAEWYEEQGRIATEHPLLDDNGDKSGSREPGGKDPDGGLARSLFFGRAAPVAVQPESSEKANTLLAEIKALQERINVLQREKDTMAPDAYSAQLEKLLIQLAKANQDLKTIEKEP